VSPVYTCLRETPRALHLARVALAAIRDGRAEVNVFSTGLFASLLAHDPDEAGRLARDVLGAVLELPADDRVTLLDTLQAWFDNAGSAERAAERLYCHPNTVRYRLRRLHELTG
jgi:DNA-binding PucR family transcriptional regulator